VTSTLPPDSTPLCLGTGFCDDQAVHLRPAVQEFEAFHLANPAVYQRFARLALVRVQATGAKRIGAAHLIERLRWEIAIETQSEDGLKINDHAKAYYARLAMLDYPRQLDGVFQTRDRTDDADPVAWINHQSRWRRQVVDQGALC
jgi:hypothetical protein